jgi:hypothetical protein
LPKAARNCIRMAAGSASECGPMTRRTSPASPYKADGESAGQLSGHCESSLEAAALWAGVSPGRQANSSARLRSRSASVGRRGDGRGEGAGSRYGAKLML